jgi:hypothetical protein
VGVTAAEEDEILEDWQGACKWKVQSSKFKVGK